MQRHCSGALLWLTAGSEVGAVEVEMSVERWMVFEDCVCTKLQCIVLECSVAVA